MSPPDTPTTSTRRSFLRQGAFAAGGGGLVVQGNETGTETSGARATQRMMIPEVDAFEDNYVGQFAFVQTLREESPDDLPSQDCGFEETWPTDETRAYNGQLLDRIQEEPVAAEIPIYTDGRTDRIDDHTAYIVQNTVECPDGYVGLEAEWVTRRALVGKDPGPTVAPTETTDTPGFSVLVAVVGGLGAIAYRALRRSGDDS